MESFAHFHKFWLDPISRDLIQFWTRIQYIISSHIKYVVYEDDSTLWKPVYLHEYVHRFHIIWSTPFPLLECFNDVIELSPDEAEVIFIVIEDCRWVTVGFGVEFATKTLTKELIVRGFIEDKAVADEEIIGNCLTH